MFFRGALDIRRERYDVYHLHCLCHGFNRRSMVNAGRKLTKCFRGLQRPAHPSDPGTPFPGFLLEYINAECLVVHYASLVLCVQ
jgi:hypothetical protein